MLFHQSGLFFSLCFQLMLFTLYLDVSKSSLIIMLKCYFSHKNPIYMNQIYDPLVNLVLKHFFVMNTSRDVRGKGNEDWKVNAYRR